MKYYNVQGEIKFTKPNIQKILDGKKTATSRTYQMENGVYRIKGTDILMDIRGWYYKSVFEMLTPFDWAVAEGYASWDDMFNNAVFKHTKEFMRGERGLWIYKFEVLK